MKKRSIHFIYYCVCYKYLSAKTERKIEDLEKILFLMQYKALSEDAYPILKCEIYIHNGGIRIPYLSDLLRVSSIIPLGLAHSYPQEARKKLQKELNKYTYQDSDSLNKKVNDIIKVKDLDRKHFVFGEYKDKRMRKKARLRVHEYQGWFANQTGRYHVNNFRKIACFSMIAPWVFGCVMALWGYIETGEIALLKNLLFIVVSGSAMSSVYLIWTYQWSRPTKHEIENGYLEE